MAFTGPRLLLIFQRTHRNHRQLIDGSNAAQLASAETQKRGYKKHRQRAGEQRQIALSRDAHDYCADNSHREENEQFDPMRNISLHMPVTALLVTCLS